MKPQEIIFTQNARLFALWIFPLDVDIFRGIVINIVCCRLKEMPGVIVFSWEEWNKRVKSSHIRQSFILQAEST